MKPEISVIVPVYNDRMGVEVTLKSLVKQDVPVGKYEIIVADNGSDDGTQEIVKNYAERHQELIKLVIEDKIQSSYAARNMGIKHAKGNILCFLDADMWVEKDYISKAEDIFKNPKIKYLGCNVKVIAYSDTLIEKHHKATGFPVKRDIQHQHYAPTCCVIVRRDVFDKVGLFDERLISGEDLEFGNRVFEAGYKQFYAEDILLYHPACKSLKKQIKRHFRYGRGRFQLSYFYPEKYQKVFYPSYRLTPKLFLRSVFLKTRKLLFIFAPSKKEKIQFALLENIYKLSQCCGFLYEKKQKNKKKNDN